MVATGGGTLPSSVLPTGEGGDRGGAGARKGGKQKKRAGRMGCTQVSRNDFDDADDEGPYGGTVLVYTPPLQHG